MHKYSTRRAKRLKALHQRINKIRPGILTRSVPDKQEKEVECIKGDRRTKIRRNRHKQLMLSGKDVILRIRKMNE